MNIKGKLEKLEKELFTDATVCPHLPPVIRYLFPDGSEDTEASKGNPTPEDNARVCECGRERLKIHFRYVENWRKPV
jgi:hypothetical protein